MATSLKDLARRPHKFADVALGEMTVSANAQRKFKPSRAAEILSKLDLDALGEPVLSERDGRYFIIDGQHRRHALADFLGEGWESQQLRCKVYCGLAEQEEARLFLLLNKVLTTTPLDKFKIALTAKDDEETKINAIVEAAGLHVARGKGAGAITAVTALKRAYRLSAKSLMFSLKLICGSYGDAGLDGHIIEGFAQLHNRYNMALDDEVTIEALSSARGGVNGLLQGANKRRLQTGNHVAICVAAEAVNIINRYRKGKKLPSWWATEAA